MTPWFCVSVLTMALPAYVTLKLRRITWIDIVACLAGLALAAAFEGTLFAAYSRMSAETIAFASALDNGMQFPMSSFVGLLFIVARALNPDGAPHRRGRNGRVRWQPAPHSKFSCRTEDARDGVAARW
jgi:hypothetical protein